VEECKRLRVNCTVIQHLDMDWAFNGVLSAFVGNVYTDNTSMVLLVTYLYML